MGSEDCPKFLKEIISEPKDLRPKIMSQIEKLERKNTKHFVLLCEIKHK